MGITYGVMRIADGVSVNTESKSSHTINRDSKNMKPNYVENPNSNASVEGP